MDGSNVEPKRCSKHVFTGRDVCGHPCRYPAVVKRDGRYYCRVHDPEAVAAKIKERDARWNVEWEQKRKGWAITSLQTGVAEAAVAFINNGVATNKRKLERLVKRLEGLQR